MKQDNDQPNTETAVSDGVALSENVDWNGKIADVKKDVNWRKAEKAINIILIIALVIIITLVGVKTFVAMDITVDGESMMPTYRNNEKVWINKIIKPERGNVVVFFKKDIDSKFLSLFAKADDNREGGKYEKLIKRVVAVAGDTIWVEQVGTSNDYMLYVKTAQGEVLTEDYYVRHGAVLPLFTIRSDASSGLGRLANYTKDNPHTVADGCFFAMGDNRNRSADSRGVLGEVPYTRLFGVVIDG